MDTVLSQSSNHITKLSFIVGHMCHVHFLSGRLVKGEVPQRTRYFVRRNLWQVWQCRRQTQDHLRVQLHRQMWTKAIWKKCGTPDGKENHLVWSRYQALIISDVAGQKNDARPPVWQVGCERVANTELFIRLSVTLRPCQFFLCVAS